MGEGAATTIAAATSSSRTRAASRRACARQFLTPYGVEFVELPELQRVYIFDIGGPHTYRTDLHGRPLASGEPRSPSYYGHSIGWWEGDTLVVDTIGFNEGFWIDRRGSPHTDKLHTLERFTRTDSTTIKYEVTVDDPGAYTAPWTSGFNLRWEDGTELFEYVCQQANYAHELMVGGEKSVDRTSRSFLRFKGSRVQEFQGSELLNP